MQLTSLSLALTRAGFLSFSPASLFAAGEPGVWYEPSLTNGTCFQDSSGTTPVTAVEQPVGLILDKSKGLVLGPELVTNGDFSNGTTGWSAANAQSAAPSVVSAEMVIENATTTTVAGIIQTLNLVAGKTYKVSGVTRRQSGDYVHIAVLDNAQTVFVAQGRQTTSTANTEVNLVFTATETNNKIYLRGFSASASPIKGFFDNISVRELPGNHATQTTSTSRPVLSARYNLLTKTEKFDDAVWTKARSTVSADVTTAPDGALTADSLITISGQVNGQVYRGSTLNAASPAVVVSFYAKAGTGRFIRIGGLTGSTPVFSSNFDALTGDVGTPVWSALDAGNGWWRFSVTISSLAAVSDFNIYLTQTSNLAGDSYTGDGTSGIYIWGASLVPANQASIPYQRVNTATDYDADPSKFKPYLRFDGVDDFLVTNSIDFTSTDKMTVFAGVRKLSDAAAFPVIAEFGARPVAGSFTLGGTATAGTATYHSASQGTSQVVPITPASYAAPITNVITGLGDISGDSAILRIDGTQAVINTSDQGTGNYGNYPLYIGRRGGTTLPFNGYLYSLIVRGAQSNTGQITSAETWVASKTGITL